MLLIVAAGTVALVCDYLRNRSQRLQELGVEPAVRPEVSVAVPTPALPAIDAAGRNARIRAAREEKLKKEATAEVSAPAPETETSQTQRHSTEMVKPALANAAEITSMRGTARPRRRPVPPPDGVLPRLEDMNPRQALAEWLDQRAGKTLPKSAEPKLEEIVVQAETPAVNSVAIPEVEAASSTEAPAVEAPVAAADIREVLRSVLSKRTATLKAAEPAPIVTPAPVEVFAEAKSAVEVEFAVEAESAVEVESAGETEPAPVALVEEAPAITDVAAPVVEPEPVAVTFPAPKKAVSVFLSTRRIDSLRREASGEPVSENSDQAAPRFELIDGAGADSNYLPSGMHDYALVERAITNGRKFRGLVIAIGVNDIDGRPANNNDVMQAIGFYIRGLLGENEFACRAGEAEFLIVCSGIEGAEAQRRVTKVSEQLWDYQLRGARTSSILFCSGASDVHHQPLQEAIAMANEQMYQTRRNRKTVSVESFRPWRKVAI